MTSLKKPIGLVLLLFAGLIAGFIFLLRGCLAKYDERFAKPPILVFEKDGKTSIFSIVEFQKTTSYSRNGGMTRKSVNTSFYIQTNDGLTAEVIKSRKVKKHRQIKFHPVEIMGAAGNNAWVFMGEPMAFDAFTLETTADKEILEQKNPSLKNLLPDERRYYDYNRNDQHIYVTAKDGSKWIINGATLLATTANGKAPATDHERKLKEVMLAIKKYEDTNDSLYQQKNYRPSKAYSSGKISRTEYERISKEYYAERDSMKKHRDSLYYAKRELENSKQDERDMERAIENLERSNPSYSEMKTYQDTIHQKWYGLYSEEEFEKLGPRIYNNRVYDETARRTLILCDIIPGRRDELVINKESSQHILSTSLLDGGFLLNKKTAEVILVDDKFLVVLKSQVGNNGTIIISCMDRKGKISWGCDTGLSQWADWVMDGRRLYIIGTNNKDLSSSEANLLICLGLNDGKATLFDYFKNKKL